MTVSDSGGLPRDRALHERGVGALTLLRSVWTHRKLAVEMTRRELTDMHAGQAAGAVWLIVHPITLFVVYAVLFTIVFKVRISSGGPADYLVYLFSGLGPWLFTQDVLSRSTHVMTSNVTIVKKVMFPTEILVAKTLLSSIVIQSVLMLLVVGYIVISRGSLSWTFILLPGLMLVHIAFLWGVSLFLSSLAPYFRDISELVRVMLTVNVYLIPVIYIPNMVPEQLRFILAINPFSYLVWCYQDVLYYGYIAHPYAWLIFGGMAAFSVALGSYTFSRLRHHFSSIL